MKVACIILTLNEESRILNCLKQFQDYVDYILVLDGESKDDTVKIAEEIADKVVVKAFSGNFSVEKNYAWKLIPEGYDWILWADADEVWDTDFLINIRKKAEEAARAGVYCFRFPRVNLPDCKNWPDYQIRFVKNSKDFEWRGERDEILWWKLQNIPLDQADGPEEEIRIGVGEAKSHPIIHKKRMKGKHRDWWVQ